MNINRVKWWRITSNGFLFSFLLEEKTQKCLKNKRIKLNNERSQKKEDLEEEKTEHFLPWIFSAIKPHIDSVENATNKKTPAAAQTGTICSV